MNSQLTLFPFRKSVIAVTKLSTFDIPFSATGIGSDGYEKPNTAHTVNAKNIPAREKSVYFDSFVEKNAWKVSPRFNKRYIAFKYGYWNVLSLEFRHAHKVALCCSQLNDGSNPPKVGNVKWEWDKQWKYWYTESEDRDYDVGEIEGALAKSYHNAVAT